MVNFRLPMPTTNVKIQPISGSVSSLEICHQMQRQNMYWRTLGALIPTGSSRLITQSTLRDRDVPRFKLKTLSKLRTSARNGKGLDFLITFSYRNNFKFNEFKLLKAHIHPLSFKIRQSQFSHHHMLRKGPNNMTAQLDQLIGGGTPVDN